MSRKSIICLQEVSIDWAGELQTLFANNKYHFITGMYGKRFNGYMGVGIAVPYEKYELLGVDIR
jgi:exonuclease III